MIRINKYNHNSLYTYVNNRLNGVVKSGHNLNTYNLVYYTKWDDMIGIDKDRNSTGVLVNFHL
jgi:hypothetical protein